MREKKHQPAGGCAGRVVKFAIAVIVMIAAGVFLWRQLGGGGGKETKTVLTSSKLEKVLQISDLSTYKVTFNGVAAVEAEDELLYNVAYHATVNIGLDMKEIQVTVDDSEEENKKITVVLPNIEIVDVEVEPGSLDYIFEESSANTQDVIREALSACKEDARTECSTNELLFALARENAGNTVKALTAPLLEQYPEYTLEILGEGGYRYE